MTNMKRMSIVGAVVATLVPALAFARKRAKGRKVVARATAAARKVAHAPKGRKTRSRRPAAAHKRVSRA
jgi:hypothetical protein